MKNKILLCITLLLYILIPILILLNDTLFKYKFYILTIVGLFIYLLFMIFGVKNKNIGISKENILKSIKRNLPIIILFVLVIIIFRLFNLNKYNPTETIYFYIFYIFVSCPIQEFLYRGVFGYFNDTLIKNDYVVLILSSLLYSLVHIIYKDISTIIITFIFGIVLYLLYRKDKNLTGVTLTHIVLGILTIFLGIVN